MLQDVLLPSWLKMISASKPNDNGRKSPLKAIKLFKNVLKLTRLLLPDIKNRKNAVWLKTLLGPFFTRSLIDIVSDGIERTEKSMISQNMF